MQMELFAPYERKRTSDLEDIQHQRLPVSLTVHQAFQQQAGNLRVRQAMYMVAWSKETIGKLILSTTKSVARSQLLQ